MIHASQPPSMSQPIIAPPTTPKGIAHQRSLPLDIEVASPPPNNPPASVPSVQSLVSYSTVVCL